MKNPEKRKQKMNPSNNTKSLIFAVMALGFAYASGSVVLTQMFTVMYLLSRSQKYDRLAEEEKNEPKPNGE